MVSKAKKRWDLNEANDVALTLLPLLEPACERLVVAGSVRRERPDVGDIELLAIPRLTVITDLFGEPAGTRNQLDDLILRLLAADVFDYRLNSRGSKTFGPLNKLLVHRSGIPVDIFSTDATNFGMALLVRTGPKEWNIKVMRTLQKKGWAGHAYGGITNGQGEEIACPEERDVFQALGWQWVPPAARL